MAKRMADTDIWTKDWYLDLPIKKKLLLKFIFDNCDCAGVYEISYRTLRNCFNEEVTKEDFEGLKQIRFIDENKVFVEDFIKFQYGVTTLNPNNSVHKGIIRCLEKHKPFPNPLLTVKDKDKVKDQNKDQDKDQDIAPNKDKNQDKNQNKDMNFDIKNHNDFIKNDITNNPDKAEQNKSDIKIHHEFIQNDIGNNPESLQIDTNNIKNNHDNMNCDVKADIDEILNNKFDIKNHNKKELKNKYKELKAGMFQEYEKLCPHLIKLTGEARSKRTDEKIRLYLRETDCDMDLYKKLCLSANKLKTIGTISIDFETMLNCRIGILNGKYLDPKILEQTRIKERAQREITETKRRIAEFVNFKGDPMPESFKELGKKLRSMK